MNLHGIAGPIVAAVNPQIPVSVQISTGPGAPGASGREVPSYATPGSITASIGGTFTATAAGSVLTVTAAIAGLLWPGDAVSGTDGINALPVGATIQSQLTGPPGGAGTYQLSAGPVPGNLGSCTVTSVSSVLTVSAQSSGALALGQTLADSGALIPGTAISGLLTGSGGIGTYQINKAQTVASEAMSTSLILTGQVQPMTWRDLQMVEGVNLGGVRWKIYLFGEVDGIVRPEKKGGDLITISTGRHQGVWLVTQVLEQFPDWVCAAIVLQNGS